jgi:hypothetical protein
MLKDIFLKISSQTDYYPAITWEMYLEIAQRLDWFNNPEYPFSML